MLRILAPALLALASLAVAAPTASATCLDTTPDDDGIGSDGCTVPVLGECNMHVLAYGQLPGSGGSCDGLVQCVRECGPPTSSSASSLPVPCSGDLNPTDDNGIRQRCQAAGMDCTVTALSYGNPTPRTFCYRIPCVSEPCATPLEMGASNLPVPCSSDLNPLDDNGIRSVCTVEPANLRCTVSALAYGPAFPPASVACQPIIVCVRECAPPLDVTAAQQMILPCDVPQSDLSDGKLGDDPALALVHCDTGRNTRVDCEATVAVSFTALYRTLECEPLVQCVTDPCPNVWLD